MVGRIGRWVSTIIPITIWETIGNTQHLVNDVSPIGSSSTSSG